MAKKKIMELELFFLHLQQNVEIPEISLNIHPIIQRSVASNKIESSCEIQLYFKLINVLLYINSDKKISFKGDDGWIKEIKKVTKLNHDPANGTYGRSRN